MNSMKIKMGLLLLAMALPISVHTDKSHANPVFQLEGAGNRDLYGSNYWKTSNIREWANSTEKNVQYSNREPSYKDEPGFLYEFSQSEQNAIAVTEHRVYLAQDDANQVKDGGLYQIDSNEYRGESVRFNLPSVDYYNNRLFHKVNDKVFILNSHQLQQFVEKRDFSLLRNLTPEAKIKHNRTGDLMSWWINAPSSNIGNDNNQFVTTNINDIIATSHPRSEHGFVPAIHIKSNATVSGVKARELKIGETISFGRYLNKPILWRVINHSSDGSPLLLSERVLDIKQYDNNGDKTSISESLTVNYEKEDITMDESDSYKPFFGYQDTTEPVFKVLNESELFSRSNSSFTLDIQATDSESGLLYIELPNGIRVSGDRFSYTVSQNKEYVFKGKDVAGNLKVFTVPVSNINPESSVAITSSSNGWTNKDVTVDIKANNEVGFTNKTYQFNSRDYTPYLFPNFTSYTGKRIRITGTYELVDAKAPVGTFRTGTGFYYRSSFKRGDDYFLSNRWIQPVYSSLSNLEQSGEQTIDYVYTIPGDYFETLQAWSQINVNSNIRDYTVRFNNLSYEVLDMDDFSIEKIILPDGREIYQDTYRDVLKSEGTYVYKVIDSRGKTTERTIEVKIDKGAPTATHRLRHNGWVKGENFIEFTSSDALSGVKEIILPNGQVHAGSRFDYRIDRNGTYTFTIVDHAGNRKTETITVKSFDEGLPTAVITPSESEWTNRDVVLEVKTSDKESGVHSIELPNGTRVMQSAATFLVKANGDYVFKVFDNMDNQTTVIYSVRNIDKQNAVIQVKAKEGAPNKVVNIRVFDQ